MVENRGFGRRFVFGRILVLEIRDDKTTCSKLCVFIFVHFGSGERGCKDARIFKGFAVVMLWRWIFLFGFGNDLGKLV